jgi:diadenosine tetraphosphate (Ap4A) HIT family hydrolase
VIVSGTATAGVSASATSSEHDIHDGFDQSMRWNIDQTWSDRVSGKSCQLCHELKRGNETSMGLVVADMRASRWILAKNQYIRGYSILVLAQHKVELFELDRETRHQFMDDVSDVARILNEKLSPIKINLEMQGNVVPHLHCHLKPRFETDTPGHARIFQNAGSVVLPHEEFSVMRSELLGHPHRSGKAGKG